MAGRDEVPEAVATVVAARGFSGVIRVDGPGGCEWTAAYGLADRHHGVPNRPDTPFAVASGAKSLTALVVMSLVEEGRLRLDQPVRSVLGGDLPLIDDRVTVEQLLAHRSGIGDYFDESGDWDPDAYALTVPVHRLDSVAAYLPLLEGHPQDFEPGSGFAYCNGGYVVLALVAERVAGASLAELVADRVCGPAGMTGSGMARTDDPPYGAAEGYVEMAGAWRSNRLHLPVVGGGDGGLYAVAGDLAPFWSSLRAGRIVSASAAAAMVRPRSDVPEEDRRYGLGFWLHRTRDLVMLEGCDAGISFRSLHDPGSGRTLTTISNTSSGVWPVTAALERVYGLA